MPFTKTYRFEQGGTFVAATVPSDKSNMWIYSMHAANDGGSAHNLRVSQNRNANAFDHRAVIPANNSDLWGSGKVGNKVLNFQSGGTVVAALDTAQGGSAGTLDVTLNFGGVD